MRSNTRAAGATIAVANDPAYFDRLPPRLREALRYTVLPFSARFALEQLSRGCSEQELIDQLIWNDAERIKDGYMPPQRYAPRMEKRK